MMTKKKIVKWVLILFLGGALPGLAACQPANPGGMQIIKTGNPQQANVPGNQASTPIPGSGGSEVTAVPAPTQPGSFQIIGTEKSALQLQVNQVLEVINAYTGAASAIFLVTNPNPDISVANVPYQVTAYNSQGYVLGTQQGLTPVIFPGEQMLVQTSELSAPPGSVASVEVQVSPLTKNSTLLNFSAIGVKENPLKAVGGVYKDGSVVCVLMNSFKDPLNANVAAVAFDAGGKIVAYGVNSVYPAPAQGQVNVTIPMSVNFNNFSGNPARVELFANSAGPWDIR